MKFIAAVSPEHFFGKLETEFSNACRRNVQQPEIACAFLKHSPALSGPDGDGLSFCYTRF